MDMHKEKMLLLSITPYRGTDLIINLLSPGFGRIAAVVYGGKKIGKESSFPYHLGDYIEIEFQIQERNEFIKIYSTHAIKLVDIEKLPYDQFMFHCHLFEIVKLITHPRNPESELIELIHFYLSQRWDQQTKYNLMAILFWQLVVRGGYGLSIDKCSKCHKKTMRLNEKQLMVFKKQLYRLNPENGELVCGDCQPIFPQGGEITSAMLKALWLLRRQGLRLIIGPTIPEFIIKALIRVLNQYLLTCFDINPKSQSMFLSSL